MFFGKKIVWRCEKLVLLRSVCVGKIWANNAENMGYPTLPKTQMSTLEFFWICLILQLGGMLRGLIKRYIYIYISLACGVQSNKRVTSVDWCWNKVFVVWTGWNCRMQVTWTNCAPILLCEQLLRLIWMLLLVKLRFCFFTTFQERWRHTHTHTHTHTYMIKSF